MADHEERRYALHVYDRTHHQPLLSVEISCLRGHCTFPRALLWHAKAKRIAEAVGLSLLEPETS
jgi:hypothetical protein